jgi:hypothetical protein
MAELTSAAPAGGSQRRGTPAYALRRLLLVVAVAAAVTAILAGLARLGISLAWGPSYAAEHGPLFVVGVFGSVIALERAVAFGSPLGMIAPVLAASAAIAILSHQPWAPATAAAGSCALLALNLLIVWRQRAAFTRLMALGSLVFAFGNLSWLLGQPVYQVVPSWLGFFVLTIVAERLELSRLSNTPRWASRTLAVLCVLFAGAACGRLLGWPQARVPFALTMLGIGVWQLRFDLARRTVRSRGLPRYAAIGVLLGAAWLPWAGGFLLLDASSVGPIYDATLHAVFLGYVVSMVFAHAPIILPAVARIDVPFSRVLYVPLAVLHVGLVARVVGDWVSSASLRSTGATANALAIVLFALTLIACRLRARRIAS